MSAVFVKIKIVAQAAEYLFGDISARAASEEILTSAFTNAYVKDNRVNNLNNGGGKIACGLAKIRSVAETADTVVALEYIYITLTSVKDNGFFNNDETEETAWFAEANAGFKFKLYVKSDADFIKSTIEFNGVNSDVACNDRCTYNTDVGCAFNKLLSVRSKKNSNIFKAVTVTATVKYVTCIYNDRFAACR